MSFHVVADDQLRVTRRAQSVCPLGVPYFTPIRAYILQMGDESQADEIASAASPARAPSPSRTTPSPA